MKAVLVVWEDACEMSEHPWEFSQDEYEYDPRIVHQIGYLVQKDENGIMLTSAYTDNQIARRQQIPAKMIKTITFLDINNE